MSLLDRKRGLAAKIETTYAADPTIAEANDSIQTRNLEVQPLDGDSINRNLDRANLGAQGDILTKSRCLVTCEVEAAGAGAAGSAAPYASLIESCGFSETINGGTDAQYDPVSTAFDSLWLEANLDGNQHIAKGARGNMQINMEAGAIPFFAFTHTGIYEPPAAIVLPTYTLSDFQTPEAFNNANTPAATLHGESIALESFTIDLQNDIQHRDVISNEQVLLVDRNVGGQISFEMPLISAKDWFSVVAARTSAAMQIIHGDTAGNIIQIDAPLVELSNPSYSESQGVLMVSFDMILKPSGSGNDEIKITVK